VGKIISWGKTCVLDKGIYSTDVFHMGFFLKVEEARPAYVGKSNYFAKRGETGKVKKGGGFNKRPPLLAKSCLRTPSLKK
jgi:hypothetical protein